jgi:hypothetical protein
MTGLAKTKKFVNVVAKLQLVLSKFVNLPKPPIKTTFSPLEEAVEVVPEK